MIKLKNLLYFSFGYKLLCNNYDTTFSFNGLSKDDYIFLICQQKMTASF